MVYFNDSCSLLYPRLAFRSFFIDSLPGLSFLRNQFFKRMQINLSQNDEGIQENIKN